MSKEVHLTLMYSVSATCLLVFLIDDLELRVQFFVLETIKFYPHMQEEFDIQLVICL
jgi:hypothetical protein